MEIVASGVLDGPSTRVDTTAPTLIGAKNRTVKAPRNAQRARVRFDVFANDDVDGPVGVSCTARSGGQFKLGRTTVRCSASDASGNVATAQFTVTVRHAA